MLVNNWNLSGSSILEKTCIPKLKKKSKSRCYRSVTNISNKKISKPGSDKRHIIKVNPNTETVRNAPSRALTEETIEKYVSARRKVCALERNTKNKSDKHRNGHLDCKSC